MAETFELRLVTPTGVVFEGQVEQVTAESPLGEFGVLPEHINFITSLVPGILRVKLPDGAVKIWVVTGGLAEVRDGKMTVLAHATELPEALDLRAAEQEEKSSEQRLSGISFYDPDYAAAEEAWMLARARKEGAALISAAR